MVEKNVLFTFKVLTLTVEAVRVDPNSVDTFSDPT